MTTAGWIALAITVFGALSYGAASILQAVAARRSASTVQTLGHPLYLAGIGCDVLAWVGSMIALRELAVYVVESLLAGSLAVTVVAARLVLKSRLRRRDVAAVLVTLTALTVLALSAGPQEGVAPSATLRWAFCGAALTVALLGWGAVKVAPAGVVAALGGLSLGGAALAGRALPMGGGALGLLTEPLTAALLTFAASGMMLYANALQNGEVGPVTAVHWTAEVLAPSTVALLLLGDAVRPGWGPAALVAGLVAVGSAVVLATAPANQATALPVERFATTATGVGHPAFGVGGQAAQEAAAHPDLAAALYPPSLAAALRPPPAPVADQSGAAPAPTGATHAERVIWWGPPPIWTPPQRSRPAPPAEGRPARALEGRPAPSAGRGGRAVGAPAARAELTWTPAPQATPRGIGPRPADADAVEAPRPAGPRLRLARPGPAPDESRPARNSRRPVNTVDKM